MRHHGSGYRSVRWARLACRRSRRPRAWRWAALDGARRSQPLASLRVSSDGIMKSRTSVLRPPARILDRGALARLKHRRDGDPVRTLRVVVVGRKIKHEPGRGRELPGDYVESDQVRKLPVRDPQRDLLPDRAPAPALPAGSPYIRLRTCEGTNCSHGRKIGFISIRSDRRLRTAGRDESSSSQAAASATVPNSPGRARTKDGSYIRRDRNCAGGSCGHSPGRTRNYPYRPTSMVRASG